MESARSVRVASHNVRVGDAVHRRGEVVEVAPWVAVRLIATGRAFQVGESPLVELYDDRNRTLRTRPA